MASRNISPSPTAGCRRRLNCRAHRGQRAADEFRRAAGAADDRGSQPQTGLLMESLMATVAQSDKEAKRRIRAFLDRKTAKVKPS